VATQDYQYDVARNGQQFLVNKVLESSEPPAITVISNRQSMLRERVTPHITPVTGHRYMADPA
jgi:hypothetical protein